MHFFLTHWGRVTHICVSKLNLIGSDNGLSPSRRQAIIRTNAGILLIGTLRTNFAEILSEIRTFSFKKMHLKMSAGRWRPFCLGLNVLLKDTTQNASDGVYLHHLISFYCSGRIKTRHLPLLCPKWRHMATEIWRSESILAPVMDCCLTALSHYLNKYWVII